MGGGGGGGEEMSIEEKTKSKPYDIIFSPSLIIVLNKGFHTRGLDELTER